jgi:predicted AAA+ superfamily ATPase
MAKDPQLLNEDLKVSTTKGKILNYLSKYTTEGGFPDVVVSNIEAKTYLDTLFDAILLKDVVKRYKVRFPQKLYELAIYLLSNFTGEFSFTRLKNILNFRSVATVENYVNFMEEAYLIITLNRFSYKVQQQSRAPKKIYVIDNGFVLAKAFHFSENFGKLMENIVFIELVQRGYKPNNNIFYYKTKNYREVDFVIKDGLKIKKLMQVTYKIDFDSKEREIKSLLEASDELKCGDLIVINRDIEKEEKLGNKIIRFIPLWKWLLKL